MQWFGLPGILVECRIRYGEWILRVLDVVLCYVVVREG